MKSSPLRKKHSLPINISVFSCLRPNRSRFSLFLCLSVCWRMSACLCSDGINYYVFIFSQKSIWRSLFFWTTFGEEGLWREEGATGTSRDGEGTLSPENTQMWLTDSLPVTWLTKVIPPVHMGKGYGDDEIFSKLLFLSLEQCFLKFWKYVYHFGQISTSNQSYWNPEMQKCVWYCGKCC